LVIGFGFWFLLSPRRPVSLSSSLPISPSPIHPFSPSPRLLILKSPHLPISPSPIHPFSPSLLVFGLSRCHETSCPFSASLVPFLEIKLPV
jgi:hypothetical protein